jgi:magnesium-transporting ATPase (P-type)
VPDHKAAAVSTVVPPITLDLASAARLSSSEVVQQVHSTPSGLTSIDARERLKSGGPNILRMHHVTAFDVFLRQVRNPLLILLLAAAGISGATGNPTDAVIITAIVVLSVGLAFFNEYRSEQAVAALHGNIHHEAIVRRDDREQRIDVRDLVPGDIVTLHIGDIVPADLRLLQTTGLMCDEAVLTGESIPRVKQAEPVAETDSDGRLRPPFFLILLGMILTYLALIEGAKRLFYARELRRPAGTPRSPVQRHRRRLWRRAARFIQHGRLPALQNTRDSA